MKISDALACKEQYVAAIAGIRELKAISHDTH